MTPNAVAVPPPWRAQREAKGTLGGRNQRLVMDLSYVKIYTHEHIRCGPTFCALLQPMKKIRLTMIAGRMKSNRITMAENALSTARYMKPVNGMPVAKPMIDATSDEPITFLMIVIHRTNRLAMRKVDTTKPITLVARPGFSGSLSRFLRFIHGP